MERLNDIMMRTVQHRQGIQEQRSIQQGEDTPPQRPRPHLARRPPLPEQTARLGQQTSYAAPQPQPQAPLHNRRMQNNPQVGSGNRGEQGARYPQRGANGQTLRQREIDRRSPVYYQRSQHRVQEQEPQYFASEQEEAKTTGDYYNAYPVMPPADVQEDWEDDAESMRYGDWETEASNDLHRYSPTDGGVTFGVSMTQQQEANWSSARALPRQQVSSPPTSREIAERAVRESQPRSPLTRNLREASITQVSAPSIPQAPTREVQGYHRNTQPLNPRTMTGMNQHIPQEVPHPVQQPTYQANVRNQALHSAPPQSYGPCPICKGAGYLRAEVPYGHPNFGKPIACECKEAERKEKRRLQLEEISNLGAFRSQTFENFKIQSSSVHPRVQDAFNVAREFARNPYGWLVLIGPNGCGKTHLAAAIANQHLNSGALVLFAVVPELLAHLRATFAPTSTVIYDQLFSRMREAELLVLDDLGAQQSSPWVNEKLFQLLNYRYNFEFPTVITTNNIGLQGIEDRIRSRMMDTSLVVTVELDHAADYRPRKSRKW